MIVVQNINFTPNEAPEIGTTLGGRPTSAIRGRHSDPPRSFDRTTRSADTLSADCAIEVSALTQPATAYLSPISAGSSEKPSAGLETISSGADKRRFNADLIVLIRSAARL